MNYSRIYEEFISDRRAKEPLLFSSGSYYEKHHIIPKSLGGGNESSNIICISASDHLFAHKLLALIHGGKMWYALHMCNVSDSACKSINLCRRWYEKVKKERSAYFSSTMRGERHHFYGKKFSAQHIKKLSMSHKGKRTGEENNKYDPNIYDFRNIDGRHVKLTKSAFRKEHGITSGRVSDICNGKRPTAHGWYVSREKIDPDVLSKRGEHHRSVRGDVYVFVHNSGFIEVCTQYELRQKYPELNQSHVSGICRGVRKKHKGWSIEK